MPHRLECGVFGQVVANVVRENLVDDHRRHHHRHEDAEGKDLARGRLPDPVVLFDPVQVVSRQGLHVGRQAKVEEADGVGHVSILDLQQPEGDGTARRELEHRAKFSGLQSTAASAPKLRCRVKPPITSTAWRPSSPARECVAVLPAEIRVGPGIHQQTALGGQQGPGRLDLVADRGAERVAVEVDAQDKQVADL